MKCIKSFDLFLEPVESQEKIQQYIKDGSKGLKLFEEFVKEDAKSLLSSKKVYDLYYDGKPSTNGWKLSILGKNLKDSLELWERLREYLVQNDIAHKFGTIKRIKHPNKEQSKKLLTIYIPDGYSVNEIAEEVNKRLDGYKGWHDIKTPTSYEHWGNAIFFRNDRDNAGNYIKAQNEML